MYFIPSVVRFATPALKSPARLRTFDAWMPPTVPSSGETAVIVTLFAEASKVVTVLLPMSCAVRVLVPVKPSPSVWGLAAAKAKWSSAPTFITTLPEVPVLAVAEVARNVPVVALPVYFMPSVVRLATPAVKSPARLRTLEAWMPPTVPSSGETG